MSFTVTLNGKTKSYEKKIQALDLIDPKDPKKKEFIACKVNNRVRELTYEVYYDCQRRVFDGGRP
jgi:hypothetical protein